jgi:hypothetical protein
MPTTAQHSVPRLLRADLRKEATASGRTRWCCTRCGKVAYENEGRAQIAVSALQRYGTPRVRHRMRSYCDVRCGWWHLTSKRERFH